MVADEGRLDDAPKEDDAVVVYAQWLANTLAEHERRSGQLAQQLSAVREAAAVGAQALVELRSAMSAQLQSVAGRLQSLEEEIKDTKMELVEVVCERHDSTDDVRCQVEQYVDALRSTIEMDLQRDGGSRHMRTKSLEEMVARASAASEQTAKSLRDQLDEAVRRESTMRDTMGRTMQQRLQAVQDDINRQVAVNKETSGINNTMLDKLDTILMDQETGVVGKLDQVRERQDAVEDSRRDFEERLASTSERLEKLELRNLSLERLEERVEAAMETFQARASGPEERAAELSGGRTPPSRGSPREEAGTAEAWRFPLGALPGAGGGGSNKRAAGRLSPRNEQPQVQIGGPPYQAQLFLQPSSAGSGRSAR